MKKQNYSWLALGLVFALCLGGFLVNCTGNGTVQNGDNGQNGQNVTATSAPFNITNNFAQDASTGFLAQWHNAANVSTQKLQIVEKGGDFATAQTITVTGRLFEGSSVQGGTNVGNYTARNVFRAEVNGLEPDTEYEYRMGDDGYWSQTFYHRTSTSTGGTFANFSFTVVTDPQDDPSGGHRAMGTTLEAAAAFDADNRFFLMAGDIVNDTGKQPRELENYTTQANKVNIRTPIAATQGNHDTYHNISANDQYRFNEGRAYNAFVTFPGNGHQFETDTTMRLSHSYYFYYNEVLFISLNTMFAESNQTAQLNWFRGVLQKDKDEGLSKYIIVFTHVSPFSPRDFDRWLADQSYQYAKVATDFNVDIYFSGHDHMYARSNPIKLEHATMGRGNAAHWDRINWGVTPNGTVLSVVSATGPKFYFTRLGDNLQRGRTAYPAISETEAEQRPGMFVNVKATADKLTVEAWVVGAATPYDTYEVPAKR